MTADEKSIKSKAKDGNGRITVSLSLKEWGKFLLFFGAAATFTIRTDWKADENAAAIEKLTANVERVIRHDERLSSLQRRIHVLEGVHRRE